MLVIFVSNVSNVRLVIFTLQLIFGHLWAIVRKKKKDMWNLVHMTLIINPLLSHTVKTVVIIEVN